MLEELRERSTTFTQAQYGRGGRTDQTALDAALSSASNAAGRVKSEHSLARRPCCSSWRATAAPRWNPGPDVARAVRGCSSQNKLDEWRTLRLADLQFWHRGEARLASSRSLALVVCC